MPEFSLIRLFEDFCRSVQGLLEEVLYLSSPTTNDMLPSTGPVKYVVFNIRKMSWTKILFIFPLCFLSVVFYGLATCSTTFLYLTIRGKEIAEMGFRNLSKSLKGEEGFFKLNSCKSGKWKSEMGGEICPKMDLKPATIRHGRVSWDHLHES